MATGQPSLFALYPHGYPAGVVYGSVAALSLFVPLPPEPKGRHRSRVVQQPGKKPFVQHYPDKKTEAYEAEIAQVVRHQIATMTVTGDGSDVRMPFTGRVAISLRFNFHKPVSYGKDVVHHLRRPDLDNLAKAVLDALQNARVIEEDNQVTDLSLAKRYETADHPQGIEIDLTAW